MRLARLVLLLGALVVQLLVSPRPATGQSAPPPGDLPQPSAPTKPSAARRASGLMTRLGFGVNGCTDRWCEEVDPMVFVRLQGLYRIMEFVAAGLHANFMLQDPDEVLHPDIDRMTLMVFGAEARGIFPYKQLDAWSGLTIGYGLAGELNGGDAESWTHGLVLGWSLGADYYVTDHLGLGLGLQIYKPFFYRRCEDREGSSGCESLNSSEREKVGIWWVLGLDLVYHFSL